MEYAEGGSLYNGMSQQLKYILRRMTDFPCNSVTMDIIYISINYFLLGMKNIDVSITDISA